MTPGACKEPTNVEQPIGARPKATLAFAQIKVAVPERVSREPSIFRKLTAVLGDPREMTLD